MLTTIITTVIAGLCVAAILAAIKSRWLYVIAPKLYLNTPISDGQIISFNIFNAGLIAEEDVAVTFRNACKFELIATSKSTLAVSGQTLSVPKLSRLESITVLLLIEGKAFDPIDIESIESKATKGKVVESKEKATAIWQNIIVVPILILLLGLPFAAGTIVGSEMQVSAFGYIDEKLEFFGKSKQLSGFKTSLRQEYNLLNEDEDYIKNSKISITTSEVVRRGDVLTINLKILNNSKDIFTVDVRSESSAGGLGPLDYNDTHVEKFGLRPNESFLVKFKTYLPENTSVKIVENSFSFSSISGGKILVSQTMDFGDS